MDANCLVQWEKCPLTDLNELEKSRIETNYLPLNYRHTKGVLTKKHRRILSHCKKMMRE